MKDLRIGIIGGGRFFNWVHAPALELIRDNFKCMVFCCCDEQQARETVAKWGYDRTYLDADEMLEKEPIDMLYVTTPPSVTGQMAIKAIERGIPAFLEKPICNSFEELKRIQDAYNKYGTPHFVAYNRRHIRILNEAKRYVQEKGGLSHIQVDWYRHDTKAPTGFMGSGIHGIDAMRYLCGDVETLRSVSSKTEYFDKQPISYSALFMFKSGISGVFNSNARAGHLSERYVLFTENGSVELELTSPGGLDCPKWLKIYEGKKLVRDVDLLRDRPEAERTPAHFNGIVDEHLYFLDCVRNKQAPFPDVNDSIKSMRLAAAFNQGFNGMLKDFKTPPVDPVE
ncbi:MAG: hypothetical protein A2293_10900 [Elusimicrobia bacterium RIFOXYB2_FULL_49_7]|nr:MAG: hypothetical protein A2293_10900 [Elusimicrobia bacterium RIFOXYB2_FULL_49_7]